MSESSDVSSRKSRRWKSTTRASCSRTTDYTGQNHAVLGDWADVSRARKVHVALPTWRSPQVQRKAGWLMSSSIAPVSRGADALNRSHCSDVTICTSTGHRPRRAAPSKANLSFLGAPLHTRAGTCPTAARVPAQWHCSPVSCSEDATRSVSDLQRRPLVTYPSIRRSCSKPSNSC